jgi:hypothetical protein
VISGVHTWHSEELCSLDGSATEMACCYKLWERCCRVWLGRRDSERRWNIKEGEGVIDFWAEKKRKIFLANGA